MKCVICSGVHIELKKVDEQIKAGKDIILAPMTVMVCSSCGERYYDRKAMKKIEEIRDCYLNNKLQTEDVGKVLRALAA